MLFRCVTKQLFISTMTPIIRCRNTSSAISLSLARSLPVVFNLTMNDKRQSPVYNVIMWACLFLGQGVQVCLYCQEWYAQKHCPRTGVRTATLHSVSLTHLFPPSAGFSIVFKRAIFHILLNWASSPVESRTMNHHVDTKLRFKGLFLAASKRICTSISVRFCYQINGAMSLLTSAGKLDIIK